MIKNKINKNTKLKVLVQIHGRIADVTTNSRNIEVFLINYDIVDCSLEEQECYEENFDKTIKNIIEKNNG